MPFSLNGMDHTALDARELIVLILSLFHTGLPLKGRETEEEGGKEKEEKESEKGVFDFVVPQLKEMLASVLSSFLDSSSAPTLTLMKQPEPIAHSQHTSFSSHTFDLSVPKLHACLRALLSLSLIDENAEVLLSEKANDSQNNLTSLLLTIITSAWISPPPTTNATFHLASSSITSYTSLSSFVPSFSFSFPFLLTPYVTPPPPSPFPLLLVDGYTASLLFRSLSSSTTAFQNNVNISHDFINVFLFVLIIFTRQLLKTPYYVSDPEDSTPDAPSSSSLTSFPSTSPSGTYFLSFYHTTTHLLSSFTNLLINNPQGVNLLFEQSHDSFLGALSKEGASDDDDTSLLEGVSDILNLNLSSSKGDVLQYPLVTLLFFLLTHTSPYLTGLHSSIVSLLFVLEEKVEWTDRLLENVFDEGRGVVSFVNSLLREKEEKLPTSQPPINVINALVRVGRAHFTVLKANNEQNDIKARSGKKIESLSKMTSAAYLNILSEGVVLLCVVALNNLANNGNRKDLRIRSANQYKVAFEKEKGTELLAGLVEYTQLLVSGGALVNAKDVKVPEYPQLVPVESLPLPKDILPSISLLLMFSPVGVFNNPSHFPLRSGSSLSSSPLPLTQTQVETVYYSSICVGRLFRGMKMSEVKDAVLMVLEMLMGVASPNSLKYHAKTADAIKFLSVLSASSCFEPSKQTLFYRSQYRFTPAALSAWNGLLNTSGVMGGAFDGVFTSSV
jgi:hypothetical protein